MMNIIFMEKISKKLEARVDNMIVKYGNKELYDDHLTSMFQRI